MDNSDKLLNINNKSNTSWKKFNGNLEKVVTFYSNIFILQFIYQGINFMHSVCNNINIISDEL